MPPAARVTDLHTCPMVTGVVPHVGGPIVPPGCPTVLIGMLPAARIGDMVTCAGPPDSIVKGSPTVLIGNMPAARMGDNTCHGGVIALGHPTTLIGDAGSGGGGGGAGGGGSPTGDVTSAVGTAAAETGAAPATEIDASSVTTQTPAEVVRRQNKAAAVAGRALCEVCASQDAEASVCNRDAAEGLVCEPEAPEAAACEPDPATGTQAQGQMCEEPPEAELLFDGAFLHWIEYGVTVESWWAMSGRPDYQSPQHQGKPDKGPIPEGWWLVKQSRYQAMPDRGIVEQLAAEAGRTNWPWGESSWGRHRVWLEPAPETQTYGRRNFSIHGGDEFGSKGCIDLTSRMPGFVDRFLAYEKDVLLLVDYSTWA